MRFFQYTFGLITLALVALSACSPASPPPVVATATAAAASSTMVTDPQQATREAAPTKPAPSPSPTIKPTASNTPVPTSTPTPVDTATPTPEPNPVVRLNESVTQQINVRGGPGTDYPIIDSFDPGEIAQVTGRNADSSWWYVNLEGAGSPGWVFARLVQLTGSTESIPVIEAAPPPTPVEAQPEQEQAVAAETPAEAAPAEAAPASESTPISEATETPSELEAKLRCGKDFCITYQAMVPIWENGGCIGNHSIYVTVLEGPPPGKPLDGIVLGDTFNNVEIASGSKGPGTAEFTLWMNTMSIKVKRHIDGTEYTSEESFPFTAHDELIPAEVLAANGYCEGSVEKCRDAQQHNQVCRGHYSYKVTFHKFD